MRLTGGEKSKGHLDDRLVGMLMLDMDRIACDAYRLRCAGDGATGILGVLLHACFVLRRCIPEHLRVGREHMKRRQRQSAR
jgi:hypothetical protein